jgi:hypothetical protein
MITRTRTGKSTRLGAALACVPVLLTKQEAPN